MVRVPIPAVRAAAAVAPLCVLAGREPILTQDTVDILVSGLHYPKRKPGAAGLCAAPMTQSIRDAGKWHMEQNKAV